jgi:dephospho-CoA kinase
MYVVGITGGIGSGKSATTDYLATQGITVVDADQASRIIVAPGQAALATIIDVFGDHLLLEDGNLDRRGLREIVFNDKRQLKRLESITHPAIEAEIRHQLSISTSPYTVLVSPLLLETPQHRLTNRILLIDAPETLQLERAANRDGANREQILAIMKNQMSRQQRQRQSHDILLNDGNLEKLHRSLHALHQRYLTLAAEK